MSVTPIDLGRHTTKDLLGRLETDGIVCLENVVSPDWLDAAVSAIPKYIATYGDADFLVGDAGDEPNTPAWQLVSSPDLKPLLTALGAAGHSGAGDLSVLRSGLPV